MLSEIEITSEVTESNYVISEVSTTQGYSLIVRVDNTLLMVTGPKELMEEIRQFVTELGYYKER